MSRGRSACLGSTPPDGFDCRAARNRQAEVARHAARLAQEIRDGIIDQFEHGQPSELLRRWLRAGDRLQVEDKATTDQVARFADLLAQTLVCSLVAARVTGISKRSNVAEIKLLVPPSYHFLGEFISEVTSDQMRTQTYFRTVDELRSVLGQLDLSDGKDGPSGQRNSPEPLIHFYESFLNAYDARLRRNRGVYFTPAPVVSYIVRSVDGLLRSLFDFEDGLAGNALAAKTSITHATTAGRTPPAIDDRRPLILDPACGTGDVLSVVVDQVRSRWMDYGDTAGWNDYVQNSLLPNLLGFELLPAPHLTACFNLGLSLAATGLLAKNMHDWTCPISESNSARLFLSDAFVGVPKELESRTRATQSEPIIFVLGNPPYSGHSATEAGWIDELLHDYFTVDGRPLGEHNAKWLRDDYVKFFRLGQWCVEQSGPGILAFVSNHGFLENPTFRGMRQQLLKSFSECYLLDLHGNGKRRERTTSGGADENVFEIQTGVAIGIFVKKAGTSGPARVHHADLHGTRGQKYDWLAQHDLSSTAWRPLTPRTLSYCFSPKDSGLLAEYGQGWSVTEIFPVHSLGLLTKRDRLAVAFCRGELLDRLERFSSPSRSAEEIAVEFGLPLRDRDRWRLEATREHLRRTLSPEKIRRFLYRPFDWRVYYDDAAVFARRNVRVLSNLWQPGNLALAIGCQGGATGSNEWDSAWIVDGSTDQNLFRRGGATLLPLYVGEFQLPSYELRGEIIQVSRRPNLNLASVANLESHLSLSFIPHGSGDFVTCVGPDDVVHYLYASCFSSAYRARYAALLADDFPRLPIIMDHDYFRQFCRHGARLAALPTKPFQTAEPAASPAHGSEAVKFMRYSEPRPGEQAGRVSIARSGYRERVSPEV
ncbi:MAG: type ISP restriction/modification enzyme [Dehalococcoidia bacterium]